jgi:1-acyl-sn-glycerol-3-phosphate acyltransferase
MPAASQANLPRDRFTGSWQLPARWQWLIRLFRWYSRRYVRKHFHAVRLSRSGAQFPPASNEPLLVVLNHPSWWDPLICIVLSQLMAKHDHYAAIDAVAVNRYRFFKKLGFVAVDTKTLRGAAEFIRAGLTILSRPNRVFWVTAQGRFTDVRERPLNIQAGVAHLAARLTEGYVLPLALEYSFWTERTPEALIRVGPLLSIKAYQGYSAKQWLTLIESALTQNLDQLNFETRSRDPTHFWILLEGRSGVGGVYDRWRRLNSWLRGKRFDPAHEAVLQEKRS